MFGRLLTFSPLPYLFQLSDMGQQHSSSNLSNVEKMSSATFLEPPDVRNHPAMPQSTNIGGHLSSFNHASVPNRNRATSFGSDDWFHGDIDGIRSSSSDLYMNTSSGHAAFCSNSIGRPSVADTSQLHENSNKRLQSNNRIAMLLSKFPPVAEVPPDYILESNIATQHLWYITAGKRPSQPIRVKTLVEQLWAKNYKLSEVSYSTGANEEDDGAEKHAPETEQHRRSVHSSTVSKSFTFQTTIRNSNNTHVNAHDNHSIAMVTVSSLVMTLQVPKYRVVHASDICHYHGNFVSSTSSLECPPCNSFQACSYTSIYSCSSSCERLSSNSPYAEYLVVVSLGGDHPVTLGFWKRHSDFKAIADRVSMNDHIVYMYIYSICF